MSYKHLFATLQGVVLFAFLTVVEVPPSYCEPVDDVPPSIEVDTSETLANEPGNTAEDRVYKAYGEWNTDGDYQGWVVTGAGSSVVSGGYLSATENAPGPPTLTLDITDPAKRANLCLGFNDSLLIRCKIPSGYTGDLVFQYNVL